MLGAVPVKRWCNILISLCTLTPEEKLDHLKVCDILQVVNLRHALKDDLVTYGSDWTLHTRTAVSHHKGEEFLAYIAIIFLEPCVVHPGFGYCFLGARIKQNCQQQLQAKEAYL